MIVYSSKIKNYLPPWPILTKLFAKRTVMFCHIIKSIKSNYTTDHNLILQWLIVSEHAFTIALYEYQKYNDNGDNAYHSHTLHSQ